MVGFSPFPYKESWNLLQDHCFVFTVSTRNGCWGLCSALAQEGRLCSTRQVTLLACALRVEKRNEEAKCKLIPETRAESLL